jgi:hypothetical protein
LLDKLAESKFANITPELKAELLHFFAEPDAPYATKKRPEAWSKVQIQLRQLKDTTATSGQANSLQ